MKLGILLPLICRPHLEKVLLQQGTTLKKKNTPLGMLMLGGCLYPTEEGFKAHGNKKSWLTQGLQVNWLLHTSSEIFLLIILCFFHLVTPGCTSLVVSLITFKSETVGWWGKGYFHFFRIINDRNGIPLCEKLVLLRLSLVKDQLCKVAVCRQLIFL